MMNTLLPRLVFLLVLAGTIGLAQARADVYTWTDAAGRVNVSNLAPPPDAHVTSVFHTSPEDAAREQAARDAAQQIQLAALSAQVQELQDQVAAAQRQPAPAPAYWLPPTTPDYQDAADTPAPQVYYDDDSAQQAAAGCAGSWNCGVWTLPFFYPASVVVVNAAGHRRAPPRKNPGYPPVQRPKRPVSPYAMRPAPMPVRYVAQPQPQTQTRSMAQPPMHVTSTPTLQAAAPVQPIRTAAISPRR